MGFFDTLNGLFDSKKIYSIQELELYFKYEIDRNWNPNIHKAKENLTTNIGEIISDFVKEKHPDAQKWKATFTSSTLAIVDEGVHRITYKGKITSIYDSYGDHLGEMYYDVIVYTNKYAELVSSENYKTTVKVW